MSRANHHVSLHACRDALRTSAIALGNNADTIAYFSNRTMDEERSKHAMTRSSWSEASARETANEGKRSSVMARLGYLAKATVPSINTPGPTSLGIAG